MTPELELLEEDELELELEELDELLELELEELDELLELELEELLELVLPFPFPFPEPARTVPDPNHVMRPSTVSIMHMKKTGSMTSTREGFFSGLFALFEFMFAPLFSGLGFDTIIL